jgi:hypothetical protein
LETLPTPRMNHGLAEARYVVLPDGIVSSGLPAAKATCAKIGLGLDPWQVGVSRCILAKDSSGLYAADTVVLSIPRQVGKTFLIGALVFADCIINPGTTTVWTAHRFKVARETFNALKSIALTPAMAAHVDPDAIYTAAGNESITFRNGSRIVFAARERGAIRGFSKVRRLILDEAQILTEAAMSDLAPTMNQAENPQMILMGTPPKPSDPGETFTNLRSEALAGKSEGVVYIEFSAEDDADLDDRAAWRVANPSYPHRTPARAIQRLRKLFSNDDDFAREALGIWGGTASQSIIDRATWDLRANENSRPDEAFALAVGVSPDRSSASVGFAGRRADGKWHVELDEQRNGVGWVAAYVADRCARNKIRAVVVNGSSPAASVVEDLLAAKVKVTVMDAREVAQSFGMFYDGVMDGTVRHTGQPQVTAALAVARKRELSGGSAWSQKNSASDITPVEACTFALWGAQSSNVKRPSRAEPIKSRAVVFR